MLSGFGGARRTSVCTAGAAARLISCDEASFAAGGEEGDQPFGSIALAFGTGDGGIGVPHGAQGVEMMIAVQAGVFVNRHTDKGPGV